MDVLVTGATGVLGRHVSDQLEAAGHTVRRGSRRTGEGRVQLDLAKGTGIEQAVEGVDAIVHSATKVPGFRRVELGGLRRLLEAAPQARFVYPSIVGIDRVRFSYYKNKLACEAVLADVPDHAIVRLTQFHEFAERFAAMRLSIVPKHFHVQSIAAREAAEQVVALVDSDVQGRVADVGGPEVHLLWEKVRELREADGRSPRVWCLPMGAFSRDLEKGGNLCPDQAVGKVTWDAWLAERAALTPSARPGRP